MLDLKSKARRRLLGYYFTNPTATHYLRELAAMLGVDPANLSRELHRLESQGVFLADRRGAQTYYRVNHRYPLYREVRSIVFKTIGVAGCLRETLQNIGGIDRAFLYGSFASNQADAASDIDLLIVGRPKAEPLQSSIRALERRLGREVNYTVFTPEEFRRRQARDDPFLKAVWRGKTIELLAR